MTNQKITTTADTRRVLKLIGGVQSVLINENWNKTDKDAHRILGKCVAHSLCTKIYNDFYSAFFEHLEIPEQSLLNHIVNNDTAKQDDLNKRAEEGEIMRII